MLLPPSRVPANAELPMRELLPEPEAPKCDFAIFETARFVEIAEPAGLAAELKLRAPELGDDSRFAPAAKLGVCEVAGDPPACDAPAGP